MNNRVSLPRNLFRIKNKGTRALSKENYIANKQQMNIQNKGLRLPFHKPFKNITNILPLIDDKEVSKRAKKIKSLIESKNRNLNSILNNSFSIRESTIENIVVLVNLKKKDNNAIANNPQECIEYKKEINDYVLSIEDKYMADPHSIEKQKDITNRMRSILVDWLIDVNIRFNLSSETFFLTISIVDRYIEKKQIKKDFLQLLGVTASLIASKYEEIYPPEVNDYVYITDNAFNRNQILSMEQDVLHILDFNLNIPSSNRFLQTYLKRANSTKETAYLAQYFLELILVKGIPMFKPSQMAAAALYSAYKITKEENNLEKITKYEEKNLELCIENMITVAKDAINASLQAVRKKYSKEKYLKVALLIS